jgi:hypothetical protein
LPAESTQHLDAQKVHQGDEMNTKVDELPLLS